MNAALPITIPCDTVADWLKRHEVTKCPTGHALGLSKMESFTGIVATEGINWREVTNRQMKHGARAAKQKGLRSGEKSRT